MTARYAIACFVSDKPSAAHWVVSGPRADVESVARLVHAVKGAHTVAAAGSDETYFARFELAPGLLYRDVGGAIFEAQRRGLLVSALQPLLLLCPDGRAEDVGDSHAQAITVGIFGPADAVAVMRKALPWARFFAVQLTDGRDGLGFEPGDDDGDRYADFVAAVRNGRYAPAEVVLLKP